jgi:hypothetical protein
MRRIRLPPPPAASLSLGKVGKPLSIKATLNARTCLAFGQPNSGCAFDGQPHHEGGGCADSYAVAAAIGLWTPRGSKLTHGYETMREVSNDPDTASALARRLVTMGRHAPLRGSGAAVAASVASGAAAWEASAAACGNPFPV